MNPSLLIILTGKTAAGKDTLVQKLIQHYPALTKVITTTSRTPRQGEQTGVDYFFLSRQEFQRKIDLGDFAEYVEYGGNLYGTEKTQLQQALSQSMIWKIDPSRAGGAREFIKRAFPPQVSEELIKKLKVIYITVSDEVVLQRLQARNLPEEEIRKRMADDAKIWQQNKDNYDYVVENVPGKLDQTVDKLMKIIEKHNLDMLILK